MKKITLLCALTLFAAVAASGCGSSAIQSIDGDTSNMGTTDAVSPTPVTTGDTTITPTEPTGDTATTDPVDTGTTTTPPDDTGDDPNCPHVSIDDQGVKHCYIVDPGPGPVGGNHLGDVINGQVLGEIHPEVGGDGDSGGGGGGYDNPGAGCSHFQSPTGGRRMKQNTGTVTDADAINGANDCVML